MTAARAMQTVVSGSGSPSRDIEESLERCSSAIMRSTKPRIQGRDVGSTYNAFGVFGTALQEKISVFHSSSLRMVSKTPNVS